MLQIVLLALFVLYRYSARGRGFKSDRLMTIWQIRIFSHLYMHVLLLALVVLSRYTARGRGFKPDRLITL